MKNIAYIGLGSNLNDPCYQITHAIQLISQLPQTRILQTSSLYQSTPWGYLEQPDFINAVIALDTLLGAEELLQALLQIEQQQGRIRTFKNAPRTLDLDILLYNDLEINTPSLILPHPRMTERAFVMIPLEEIAPALIFNKHGSIKAICSRLQAENLTSNQVKKISSSNSPSCSFSK